MQELIFILEYKLHQLESDILKMRYWIGKKRYQQFVDYKKMQKEEMEKTTGKIKKSKIN